MGQVTKETLISSMYTYPSNEREIGFNSALIFILKRLIDAPDVPEHDGDSDAGMLKYAFNHLKYAGYDKLSASDIVSITANAKSGSKLQAVKDLKAATNLGLKESKDVIDAFCDRVNLKS